MGSLTEGVTAGIAAYQRGKQLEELQTLRERQALIQRLKAVDDVRKFPAGKIRAAAIDEMLLPLGVPEAMRKTIATSNDEEYDALRNRMSELVADNPSVTARTLKSLGDAGYLTWEHLLKAGGDLEAQRQQKELAGVLGQQPAPRATPTSLPPSRFTLPTEGETTQGVPLAAQAPVDPLQALDQQARYLSTDVPKVLAARGIPYTPDIERNINAALQEINIQRTRLRPKEAQSGVGKAQADLAALRAQNVPESDPAVQALKREIEATGRETELREVAGPGGVKQLVRVPKRLGGGAPEFVANAPESMQSNVGQMQADLSRLLAQGQGESSPAVQSLRRSIAAAGTSGDQAQSPVGKLLEDHQRAIRVYGANSPQAATIKEQIDQLQTGGQVTQSDVHNMRSEFTRLSHDYLSVRDAYGRIQSAAVTPSQAGDLALLTSYMKLIDPTTGVREGELATASNAASIPERIRGLYNRLLTTEGGRMSDAMRKDFVGQAKNLYLGHERNQKALEAQYRGLAKKQRMDPEQVVVQFITRTPTPEEAEDELKAAKGGLIDSTRTLLKELESGPRPSRRR